MGHAARAFSPFGRCSLWACGPSFFLERVLFALRALFFLGLRPGLFCPPGILPPAGNFLLAQKVPQKRLPPVALRGLRLTTHNPHGAIRNSLEKHPSLATLLGLSSPAPISEGRGTLCKIWRVSAVSFEATSENMPHPQPSWGFPHLPPSARVAEHCAKYGGCQQQFLWPTACFQQAAI